MSNLSINVNTISTDDLIRENRPYMKLYLEDFMYGCRSSGLKLEEIGMYIVALAHQFRSGRPLRNDMQCFDELRHFSGVNIRSIRRVLPILLDGSKAKFEEIPDGSGDMWNVRVVREITAFVEHKRRIRERS